MCLAVLGLLVAAAVRWQQQRTALRWHQNGCLTGSFCPFCFLSACVVLRACWPASSSRLPACLQVLRQAAQLLKPGGKLLLLEHGRGTWDIVNSMIDERAERHYRTYGCWYNRDILSILQDAGLQVDSLCRWHFGTSYVIVASPASPQQLAQPPSAAHQAAQAA